MSIESRFAGRFWTSLRHLRVVFLLGFSLAWFVGLGLGTPTPFNLESRLQAPAALLCLAFIVGGLSILDGSWHRLGRARGGLGMQLRAMYSGVAVDSIVSKHPGPLNAKRPEMFYIKLTTRQWQDEGTSR